MNRPPLAARVPAYRELAAVWPVLLAALPEQVAAQATRQAEVDARRAGRAASSNGHPGARR
jgi:hypothetical protein